MSQVIPTSQNTRSITDMREQALALLNQVEKKGPTYILHRSKPRAVLLSIREYKAMYDELEAVESLFRSIQEAQAGEAKILRSLRDFP